MQLDSASALHETPPVVPDSDPGNSLSPWRRHGRWWLAAGVALLLLILVPPLVNANRFQRQIARSMSLSLGRPVHLDNVSLHLLPVPGLTLSNLVVSEDPAFGDEPTIRANTVEASLRLGSLWRRRVEFSTIRFEDPSVNLVRNAAGRWNLAEVLLHAAQVQTAPTAQRRAGPAPRFPYIEATGGRVNLKLGEEKLPYSLTESDFALWQPSPHQWRVRLRGQPDRTDINMTDPGTLRVEGDLLQATLAENVRVDLRASWHNAPVGETSLLLLGRDMNWRGTVNVEAALAGTLQNAVLRSQLTLGGLRRAEFAPAHPLVLQITCGAGLSIQTVSLSALACTLPVDAPLPATLRVPTLDLQRPNGADATLEATAVPTRWALLWAGLFSTRVPTEAGAAGTLDVHLQHGDPVDADLAAARVSPRNKAADLQPDVPWSGFVRFHPPVAEVSPANGPVAPQVAAETATTPEPLTFQLVPSPRLAESSSRAAETVPGGPFRLKLDPTLVAFGPASMPSLQGEVSTAGYLFSLAGVADRAALLSPTRYLPPLAEGLEDVLPAPKPEGNGSEPLRLDFTCSAGWGSPQVCTSSHTVAAKGKQASAAARRPARRR